MRVGIDLSTWANARGYGRYTRELVKAMVPMAPDIAFTGYLDPASRALFQLEAPNLRCVDVPQGRSPAEAASADGNRSPADMLRFTRTVWRDAPDVFFSPSVYTFFPLPPGQRAAIAIHDTIADRFPELTLPTRRARAFWRAKIRLAIWQADLVLTVSDYSAGEISSFLRVPAGRIRVTGEAPAAAYRPSEDRADIARVAAAIGLPPDVRWFTYVGGFNPHKRIEDIVRAFAAAVRTIPEPRPYLLLVGSTSSDVFHRDTQSIRAAIADSGVDNLVRWTGFVPDEELCHLHSGALALVMFSQCEGFGLPAVEAAACGTPVVAPTASPLPRLLEGGGLFVEPGDVAALERALTTLATDEATQGALGRVARERAAALTWTAAAQRALAALRELAP